MLKDCNLPHILSHWGLEARHIEKVKDVYQVSTVKGQKNLKVSPLNLQRLAFVHSAIRHLQQSGFSSMYPIIPTKDGRTYICCSKKAFSLFDWIEGRQCDFTNLDELREAGKILADFHLKSVGFHPPVASNSRDQMGKCLMRFEERYLEMVDYANLAKNAPADQFSRIYLSHFEDFTALAEQAIFKLRHSSYPLLVLQARVASGFCHGDPAARNFILTPQNRIYLIDFDSCRLDLPIMDLIKLTRRVMKKHHWSYSAAKLLIDAYREIHPLNRDELDVMKAVFYFPQKFWRMANRHFHNHGRYSSEKALAKLRKYLAQKDQLARFGKDFENYR